MVNKMFYSMEEVQQRLGRSAEEIKQLVRDGELREFRDGAKIMFKVDEVDGLLSSGLSGSGDVIPLSPADSVDQYHLGDTGSSIGLVPGDSADHITLDDTINSVKEDKDGTVVTEHGVNALEDSGSGSNSGADLADPLAQTQIAPDFDDSVDIESAQTSGGSNSSSGSGLLDLTREADDTSLGAELLEEIYPGSEQEGQQDGSSGTPSQFELGSASGSAMALEPEATVVDYTPPRETFDPTSGVFGVIMLVPLLTLILISILWASAVADVKPPMISTIGRYIWYITGGLVLVVLGIFFIGNTVVKNANQPKQPRQPMAKKKKGKKKA